MGRIFWKSRRVIGLFTSLLCLYLVIRVHNYEHKAFVFLPKVHPNEVWEFVADFSNMMYLNPTIVNFNIVDESGNYEHWKYSVEYSEKLSHWPYSPNHAIGHFDVKASPKKDFYFIHSTHRTCLFNGFYCLESKSEFKFTHSNSSEGAACEELIVYQCPAILSYFCRREVTHQRTAIVNNLRRKFSSKVSS